MTVGLRGSWRPRRSRDRTLPSSRRSSTPASAWSGGTTNGGRRNGGRGSPALPDDPGGSPWAFASDVAKQLDPPEDVYVMDVCEADGRLWLLELNPFSGADLYACRCDDVVAAVGAAALRVS